MKGKDTTLIMSLENKSISQKICFVLVFIFSVFTLTYNSILPNFLDYDVKTFSMLILLLFEIVFLISNDL